MAHWDGSFQLAGAAIGISICKNGHQLLTLAIPVAGRDATRVEALGPPLIALILAQLE